MNKHTFQKLSLLRKSNQKCIHTRNIYSLIDLNANDDFATKLNQHLKTCQVCQDEFERYKHKQMAIGILVPKPQIDTELKKTFENEVELMFESFTLDEKEFHKKQIKEKMLAIDSLGASFLKHITSPRFLYLYAGGVILYYILRNFN